MNCKKGDLAIVVISTCGNEGKIVRCVEFAGDQRRISPVGDFEYDPCWIVEPNLPDWSGGRSLYTADHQLKPLRDSEGDDETLAWAGKPIRHVVNEAFDAAWKGRLR